ncbi:MAG: Fic family protein [Ruminococcus sp.]|nr:Fic family protein [Ruminococcus sp.]
MLDPYCYKDSNVLINKLNIRDSSKLDIAEVEFSCNAIHELSIAPISGKYDFKHFCEFHRFIFGDIYERAGKIRTIEIEKEEPILGYMSVEYAKVDEIVNFANLILTRMNNREWHKMSLDEQSEKLSKDLADLWKIHPFREGNTRTTITFICQFADSKGMPIVRDLFETNAVYTRNALVAASAYYKDADFSKIEYLQRIIKDSLERGKSSQ